MSQYKTKIAWARNGAAFIDNRYSRAHVWHFDGGTDVPASASPQIVPSPYSDAVGVDPEEAFVASLSSCHMLWFLSIAAKRGFTVDSYVDEAVGVMGTNVQGKTAITQVTLCPKVEFVGQKRPSPASLREMHDEAHEECFIANSVNSVIRCEPQM